MDADVYSRNRRRYRCHIPARYTRLGWHRLVAPVFICTTSSDDMVENLYVLSSPLNGGSAGAELVPTDPLSEIKFCVL